MFVFPIADFSLLTAAIRCVEILKRSNNAEGVLSIAPVFLARYRCVETVKRSRAFSLLRRFFLVANVALKPSNARTLSSYCTANVALIPPNARDNIFLLRRFFLAAIIALTPSNAFGRFPPYCAAFSLPLNRNTGILGVISMCRHLC